MFNLMKLVDLGRLENKPIIDSKVGNEIIPSTLHSLLRIGPAHPQENDEPISDLPVPELSNPKPKRINPKTENYTDQTCSDTKIVAALMGFSMEKQFSREERINPAFLSDTPIPSVKSDSKRPNYSYSYNPKYARAKDQELIPENVIFFMMIIFVELITKSMIREIIAKNFTSEALYTNIKSGNY
ncbi:hypothetical protein BpHYR1_039053 [Brachionus plicatilis]|uniref:Uncharacterized protein n=1 Tax=Brachionus plicatilis TaxID=10195 RepID=A0A3M7S3J4_BRAPC|nr:hypothetical protein BpHYR1_039053 [Brachionus plicatilis]